LIWVAIFVVPRQAALEISFPAAVEHWKISMVEDINFQLLHNKEELFTTCINICLAFFLLCFLQNQKDYNISCYIGEEEPRYGEEGKINIQDNVPPCVYCICCACQSVVIQNFKV
jgi:hypothetical protein